MVVWCAISVATVALLNVIPVLQIDPLSLMGMGLLRQTKKWRGKRVGAMPPGLEQPDRFFFQPNIKEKAVGCARLWPSWSIPPTSPFMAAATMEDTFAGKKGSMLCKGYITYRWFQGYDCHRARDLSIPEQTFISLSVGFSTAKSLSSGSHFFVPGYSK